MGWLFTPGATITDVRNEIINDLRNSTGPYELVAHRSTNYGRHLWIAVRPKTHHPEASGRFPFVGLYLLRTYRREGILESGYKDMDESCGPCEKDCPVDLLDLTGPDDLPDRNDWAREWRAAVREETRTRQTRSGMIRAIASTLAPGVTMRLQNRTFTVHRKCGGGWVCLCHQDSRYYNVRPKFLADAAILTLPTGPVPGESPHT